MAEKRILRVKIHCSNNFCHDEDNMRCKFNHAHHCSLFDESLEADKNGRPLRSEECLRIEY